MLDENVKNATLIKKVTENPDKLLTAILIGNNLVNIGASSLATSMAVNKMGNSGATIVTFILTFVILVFGEITPKTFATKNCEKVALFVIKPISFCILILTPVIFLLNLITGFLLRLLGIKKDEKQLTITENELITMVNVGHEEGVLEINEREMITNVFDFANSDAKDVMIPRTDIIAVNINASLEEIKDIFKQETYSRMPVYDESLDNIVGIITLKDLLFIEDDKDFDLTQIMREPFFTYESKPLKELFTQMRTERIPIAIIADEYGGTAGIVTLEDMLEEIVGDLADEYDEVSQEIKLVKDHEYIVEGVTKINDVNEMLGTNFTSEDCDSIGGFIVETIGKFPEKGEIFKKDSIKFIIEEIDKNRVEKIRILTHVTE